ncbi:MAG: GGDEF domain-containing phosphodiesterase [Pseudomonadota bacterium]
MDPKSQFRFPSGDIIGSGHHAMLLIAIDNLFPLEQFFGDAMVADVLKAAHDRLKSVTPRFGTLWQPQSRRFAIAVPGMSEEGARHLARDIQTTIAREPVETSSGPVSITVSVGCAVAGNGSLVQLGNSANDALIEAVATGSANIRTAQPAAETRSRRDRAMCVAQTTMEALGAGHLTMAYQPVVSAQGGTTIAFHECLARITLPDNRVMPAAEFMPTAERLGLATMIDRQVLVQALERLRTQPSARLSVNLYPHSMQDPEWLALFRNGIRDTPEIAERLIVEITETGAILDPARTRRFMNILRETGVCFALDDFGAGHTSFSELRDLRFDILKIDQSFTADVKNNPDNRFFIETLVSIAERFEMMSIGEGVQDAADARLLAQMGVGYFQGFFFGSPSLVLKPLTEPEISLKVPA